MSRINVGIDIKGSNANALRAIAGVKLALAGLGREQTRTAARTDYLAKQTTQLNRSLHAQSQMLRGLTLDYFKLRRILLTFSVRTALTGLTAVTAAANSAAVSIGVLGGSIANLGAAGVIGGIAAMASAFQGMTVISLAWSTNLTKALHSSGKTFEKAMAKLTKPARDFVNELKGMRGAYDEITLLAQKGLFPGLVRALRDLKPLLPIVKQMVYDTAQMIGYLAERFSEMAAKRGPLFERFFTRNIHTMERLGRAAENIGFAFLEGFKIAGPLIGTMTKDVEKFSRSILHTFESKSGGKVIKSFFGDLKESWKNWTATIGAVGTTLFNIWDAIQPVIHDVEDSIERSTKKAAVWTGKNKDGIADYFRDSLEPMAAFLRLFGGLAKLWVDFSKKGNDDAVRVFDGLRTHALPVLRDLFTYMDAKVFPRLLDIGGAFLDFIHTAMPGIKGLLSLLGPFASIILTILNTAKDLIAIFNGNEITSAMATFAVSGMILSSWKKLRTAVALTLLTVRSLGGAPGAVMPRKNAWQGLVPGIGISRGYRTAVQGVRSIPHIVQDTYIEAQDRGRERQGNPVTKGGVSKVGNVIVPDSYARKMHSETVKGVGGGFKSFFKGSASVFRGILGAGGFGPAIAMIAGPALVTGFIAAFKDRRPEVSKALDEFRDFNITDRKTPVNPHGKQLGYDPRILNLQSGITQAVKDKDVGRLRDLQMEVRKLGDEAKLAGDKSRLRNIADDIGSLQSAVTSKLLGTVVPDFETFGNKGADSVGDIQDGLVVLQTQLYNKLPAGSDAYQQAMTMSFSMAADSVQEMIDRQILSMKKGDRELRKIIKQQLEFLGFTPEEARNIARGGANGGRYGSKAGAGNEGGTGTINYGERQTNPYSPGNAGSTHAIGGGFYLGSKGQRGRDNIPMNVAGKQIIAGAGEYVGIFNHTQQQAFDHMAKSQGYGSMEGFFRGNSRPHYMSVGGIVDLGHRIQGMGPYMVGEQSSFGKVHPVHVKGSLHYQDRALDINADGAPGGEPKWLDKLASILNKEGWHVLWRVADHFDHLHVDDASGNGAGGMAGAIAPLKRILAGNDLGNGVLKGITQGGLDLVGAAAQSMMDSLGLVTGGSGDVGEGDFTGQVSKNAAANMRTARQMMNTFGWGPDEWPSWKALGMGESGWVHKVNPSSGAFGIGQFLGGTRDTYAKYGANSLDPFWQINAMGHYIKDRYGSPSKAYSAWLSRSPHWYSEGGLVEASTGATFSVAAPKPGGPLPSTNPDDAFPPYDRPGTDVYGKPLKKKKKKKPAYKYIPGMPALGQGFGRDDFKPRGKKKSKKKQPSRKAKHLANQPFKFPTLVETDPITGEQTDLKFMRYDYLGGLIDDWNIELTNLVGIQGLTEEQSIVTDDAGNEVINSHGMRVGGKFIPGIEQFVAEQMAQLELHEGRQVPYGGGKGIVGAMAEQQNFLSALPTQKAIKEYRTRLTKMRKFVLRKIALRKKYKAKLDKLGGTFGWKKAASANDDIIQEWIRWKRDARGESPEQTRKADHEIDRLRDENKWLRDKKPKPQVVKAGVRNKTYEQWRQQRADLRLLVGSPTANGWSIEGGAAAQTVEGLRNWTEVDSTKQAGLKELASTLPAERLQIAQIRKEIGDWTGTQLPSNRSDTSQRDDALKQIGTDALRGRYIDQNITSTLAGIAQMFGMRQLGAFAHGGPIPETGMALLHRGEYVLPAPDGPFRNGMNSPTGAGGDVYVEVIMRDKAGALVEVIDTRIRKVAPNATTSTLGRRTRGIRASGGSS